LASPSQAPRAWGVARGPRGQPPARCSTGRDLALSTMDSAGSCDKASSAAADISTITPGTNDSTQPDSSMLMESAHTNPASIAALSAGLSPEAMHLPTASSRPPTPSAGPQEAASTRTTLHEAACGGGAPAAPNAGYFVGAGQAYLTPYQMPTRPVSPRPRLLVEREDCELGVASPSGRVNNIFCPASPSHSPLKLDALHQEVYVQRERQIQQFKPVPVARMRRALANTKPVTPQQTSWVRFPACVSHCNVLLDPDIGFMQMADPMDVDILELIGGAEQVQAMAAGVFFTLQAVAAGLSVTAGLMASGAADHPPERLERAWSLLEPGLGCLSLTLAQMLFVGNALAFMRARARVAAFDGLFAGEAEGPERSARAEGARRRSVTAKLFCLLRLLANTSVLLCCLVGSRGVVILLHRPWSDGVEWPSHFSRNLLISRCLFGLTALGFALHDIGEMGVAKDDGGGAPRAPSSAAPPRTATAPAS